MSIHEVIIKVADVERAIIFYTEVCGFVFVRSVEHQGAQVAELDADGQRITLVYSKTPGVQLALHTDDSRAAIRRMRRHEVPMTEKPLILDGASWIDFADPWGNRLGWFEDPPAGAATD